MAEKVFTYIVGVGSAMYDIVVHPHASQRSRPVTAQAHSATLGPAKQCSTAVTAATSRPLVASPAKDRSPGTKT
jgi:hypothetical protein